MTQYGQKVILLSEQVRKFCLKQGNVKQVNFLRQMEFAAWAFKELFRTSVWELTTVVLDVDPHKHTITIPDNCERLVNISVIDRFGQIQPLTWNPNLSTVDVLCQKNSCSCHSCGGHDTLCEALDNITVIQETITFGSRERTQVTYIKNNGCGSLEKEIHTWGYDPINEETIQPIVLNELLCTIEVNDKGCLLPTKPNIDALQTYCGFNASLFNNGYWGGAASGVNPYRSLIPTAYNFYGYWNWNAACRDTIHIFRSKRKNSIFVNDPANCESVCGKEENDIKKVILSFQTSANTEGVEMLIPEYASMAVDTGILYQQALFNPRDGDRSRAMETKWRTQQRKVQSYLNPVRMDSIRKVQSQPRPW